MKLKSKAAKAFHHLNRVNRSKVLYRILAAQYKRPLGKQPMSRMQGAMNRLPFVRKRMARHLAKIKEYFSTPTLPEKMQ